MGRQMRTLLYPIFTSTSSTPSQSPLITSAFHLPLAAGTPAFSVLRSATKSSYTALVS